MDWGCIASAPSTPTAFHSKQTQKNHTKSTTYYSYPLSTRSSGGSSRLSVKASSKSFPTRNRAVNSHWNDVSVSPALSYPSRLPRLRELDPTDMLLRQRIVFLGNEVWGMTQIDDYTADFIVGQLLYLDAEDSTKDIKLFINSPGGSSTAAMGIYDTMKLCEADVSTICMGLAASMAAFILATGTKGKRFCMPNSRVMIHRPEGYAAEEEEEVCIASIEGLYHGLKQIKILSRVTGKPVEQIERNSRNGFFMNPWEAKEYGLVDEVIDDGKPGLVAPLADSSAPPFPGEWFLWRSPYETISDGKHVLPEDSLADTGSIKPALSRVRKAL
ncbi:hypothetical protein RHGRI_028872 [Rhododendron griersonianum]|uniref:ATP-dependent Clp protease proteolytic subunit n=1 Tax=Rhododendron griersonianum TaxID=479676 RepID=A0AAV6IHN4_9ERIC|nr:hypothetical protein RHGRI_028872 [Rhododendron griersonianum]